MRIKTTTRIKIAVILILFAAIGFGASRWRADAQRKTLPDTNNSSSEPQKSNRGMNTSDDPDMIMFNARPIDSRTADNFAGRSSIGGFTGKRMMIVKYNAPIRGEWVAELKSSGVKIVDYIPSYAYLVYGDQDAFDRLLPQSSAAESPISWIGDYTADLRIQPDVYSDSGDGRGEREISGQSAYYLIQLVADEPANAATKQFIELYQTDKPRPGFDHRHYVNLVAALAPEGVAAVAKRDDVISISRFIEPRQNDERQSMILAGNLTNGIPNPGDYLSILNSWGFTQAQFNLSGFVVDVTDDGADRNPGAVDPGSILQDSNSGPIPARHFVFYENGLRSLGETTPTGTSRFVYKGRWGADSTGDAGLGLNGHGQLNMSIVGGYVPGNGPFANSTHRDASGFRYGLGVAPFVKMANSVIFDPDFTSPDFPAMISAGYTSGARISTNSWGAPGNGNYTALAQTYDGLVRDAQITTPGHQAMIVTFSAGNDGSAARTIGAPGTAKNVITVGAAEGVQPFGGPDGCGTTDTSANNANDIADFSSRGPTTDGRVKPDIQAPGTHISGIAYVANGATGNGTSGSGYRATGVCGGFNLPFFPFGQVWYTASSGTSHSTPAVAGGAALIYQQFINKPAYLSEFRRPSGSVPPTPAMTKAYLINSTRYLTGAFANDRLPSNSQGFGMMNLGTAFDGVFRLIRDQVPDDTINATGQVRSFTGAVTDGSKPFRVTLAYTDAPGSTTGNAFVNNLDLEVTIGGKTYKGNVFAGQTSVTGGTADIRNNVESVFLPAGFPAGTPYLVRVIGTNIAGDGVPDTPDLTDQDFALVVYNANDKAVSVLGSTGQAVTQESCLPSNNHVDSGETVTVDLTVRNLSPIASNGPVKAFLQSTGGVTSPSASQTYGVLAPNAAATRPFTFTIDPSKLCGEFVTVTLALSDSANNLGQLTYLFRVGRLIEPIAENFDALAPPAVPSGWSVVQIGAANPWETQASTPDSGTNSVFASNPASPADNQLVSPLLFASSQPTFSFSNSFDTERNFDGGVLELSINEGPWQDILAAGGTFTAGGYNGTLSTNTSFLNPLAGRAAWTGNSQGYITTNGTLPASVAGNYFRLRWRMGTDNAVAATGWRIDSISVAAGVLCCGQVEQPAPAFLIRKAVTAQEVPGAFNSDSDGFLEPGELISLNIPLENIGAIAATATTVTLSTSSTNVFIAQGTGNYGTINGQTTANNSTFQVRLLPSLTPFSTVNMTATINYNGGPVLFAGTETGFSVPTTQGVSDFSFATSCRFSPGTNSTISNTTAISIPGTIASGVQPASLYPSPVTVSGMSGAVTKVTVTLSGISHRFMDDIDVVLVGPDGQAVVLMSDIGGNVTGRTYVFDDSAPAPLTSAAASGSYLPTNSGASDDYPAPGPGTVSQPAPLLSSFNGSNPNGVWNLYIVDDFGSIDSGSLSGGWSLTVQTQAADCSTTAIVPTAAGVTVGGRVVTSGGQAVRGAIVTLTNARGESRSVRTGTFGLYRFDDVAVGELYTITAAAPRMSFAPRVVQVDDAVDGLDFVPE